MPKEHVRQLRRRLSKYTGGAGALLRGGLPDKLFYYGAGIGDDLLCTAIFRELCKRGHPPVTMVTAYPALFEGNPDVGRVLTLGRRFVDLAAKLGRTVIIPDYIIERLPLEDRTVVPPFHILARICEQAGVSGPINLRPYLFLSGGEKQSVARRQAAIQSAGMTARFPMRNKQWYPERFQAVVDALKHDFDFVQVGDPADPPLDGVRDLRGKTSLRQTAAVLQASAVFVGQVGFLMHLARAVDCRSVVVYGGRERPDQTGYVANENLYTPLPCSPCWRENACDFGRECMDRITPDVVVEAVLRQAEKSGQPLPVETHTLVFS